MSDTPASTEAHESEPTVTEVPDVPAARTVKRRPARRPSKPDGVLAEAVETARNALLDVAGEAEVGEHLGVYAEAERLVTHRFAANVPGYAGWHWFATLARVPRGKEVTVCETGLLPSGDALLAPDWVPWSERVRPEDTAGDESQPDGETEPGEPETADHAQPEPGTPGGDSPVV